MGRLRRHGSPVPERTCRPRVASPYAVTAPSATAGDLSRRPLGGTHRSVEAVQLSQGGIEVLIPTWNRTSWAVMSTSEVTIPSM